MTADSTARVCKKNLQSYLALTNTLTRDDRSPTSSLLYVMNELLKTIVDTNFNRQSSLPSVGLLYETINSACLPINESGQNPALIYFARSLAVVLEEAVCRFGGEEQTNQSSRVESCPPVVATVPAAAATVAVKPAQTIATAAESATVAVKPTLAVIPAAAATPIATGTAAARKWGSRIPDYSPEAIAGRIIISNISHSVKRQQLVDLLTPIDPSVELSCPPDDKRRNFEYFTYAKFSSNEKADEAVQRLHRMVFNGRSVTAKRVEYWLKDGPAPTHYRHLAAHAALATGCTEQGGTDRDYSPEAIAGRINIWCIPVTVKRQQLVDLLALIDANFELRYPLTKNGSPRGFAYVKFKSNEKANEALQRLKGTRLNGKTVMMKRTEFWFKFPLTPTKDMLVGNRVEMSTVDRVTVDQQAIQGDSASTNIVCEDGDTVSWDSDDLDHVD